MPLTLLNIGAILLLILPGFLAYRFAVWRRADPTNRSSLWQVSEILEYSVYVHLIGALWVIVIHLLFKTTLGIDTHIKVLLQEGPDDFLTKHFTEAIIAFILYPTYVILSSAILGAYQVPQVVSLGIVRVPGWLARYRLFRWIPVPSDAYPQEPVWHYAFSYLVEDYAIKIPHAMVTLKSGDAYFGELATYPIVPDTENEKDFLIVHAIYYKDGDMTQEQRLDSLDGIGAVLLNTANVDSIKIYYHDDSGGMNTQ